MLSNNGNSKNAGEKRIKKSIERLVEVYKNAFDANKERRSIITDGSGVNLGDIVRVKNAFHRVKIDKQISKNIHLLCYKTVGQAHKRNSQIKKFNGYNKDDENEIRKRLSLSDKMNLGSLKLMCDLFNIPVTGKQKKDISMALVEFLKCPFETDSKIFRTQALRVKIKRKKSDKNCKKKLTGDALEGLISDSLSGSMSESGSEQIIIPKTKRLEIKDDKVEEGEIKQKIIIKPRAKKLVFKEKKVGKKDIKINIEDVCILTEEKESKKYEKSENEESEIRREPFDLSETKKLDDKKLKVNLDKEDVKKTKKSDKKKTDVIDNITHADSQIVRIDKVQKNGNIEMKATEAFSVPKTKKVDTMHVKDKERKINVESTDTDRKKKKESHLAKTLDRKTITTNETKYDNTNEKTVQIDEIALSIHKRKKIDSKEERRDKKDVRNDAVLNINTSNNKNEKKVAISDGTAKTKSVSKSDNTDDKESHANKPGTVVSKSESKQENDSKNKRRLNKDSKIKVIAKKKLKLSDCNQYDLSDGNFKCKILEILKDADLSTTTLNQVCDRVMRLFPDSNLATERHRIKELVKKVTFCCESIGIEVLTR